MALMTGQHGLASLDQLVRIGLTARAVQQRAAAGRLHRIHHAVYSLVPRSLLKRDAIFMAATLACGPGAVLSHRSAAALLQLRASDRAKVDVTVPERSSRVHSGVDTHRSITLIERDTTVVNDIPCTTVARTFLDLALVLNRRALERAFDQAEVEGVLNARAVADQLIRNPNRAGAAKLKAVLHEHVAGSTFTWNDFEERFLALIRAAELPEPEVNAWIDLGDGEPPLRPDFLWRDRRAVVETDGHGTHRTRQGTERDRRNDQRLTLAGWGNVRLTWLQLRREPKRITATVTKLLGL